MPQALPCRPVKLRIEGFPEDIASLAEHLEATPWANVLDYSKPYPNRRGLPGRVRVYMDLLIGPDTDGPRTTATPVDPRPIDPTQPTGNDR